MTLSDWVDAHRTLFEVFLDAYCVFDTQCNVVDFNEAFMELTGESYRKVLKIGQFQKLIQTELGESQCPAKQIIDTAGSVRIDELNGSTKAYPNAKLILGGVPVTDAEGSLLGGLLTIRNVSAESELQKKYDERKKESTQDGLTKLFNKTYSEGMLLRMLKTAMRSKAYISVMMCDIDHFKKVNDTYGHQAGDHVLATVAEILKGVSRDTDLVGRFGGEEFMCVLAGTDQSGAKVFAERFRTRVENTVITYDNKRIPVTVSLGTATLQCEWKEGVDAQSIAKDIVSHADTALYFAKANGRNRAAQYETLPAGSNKKTEKKAA